MNATIYQDVPASQLRQLAVNVCLMALEDVKARDPLTALDAFLWLTGPDAGMWLEWAGLPFSDPLAVLTNGLLNRTRVRRKGKDRAK